MRHVVCSCAAGGARAHNGRRRYITKKMRWPELTAAIDEFCAVRGRTIEMTIGISEERANRRVRPRTWSVAEVLDHLIRTEAAYRKFLQQTVEQAHAGTCGTIRIGFDVVDTALRPMPRRWMPILTPLLLGLHAMTPFRVRLAVMRKRGLLWAAAPRIAEPRPMRKLHELRADLAAQMQTTASLLDGELPDTLPRVYVRHPLYGSNDVRQIVRMMAAHEERHQHQIRVILRDV